MSSDNYFSKYPKALEFLRQHPELTIETAIVFLKQQLEENFLENKIREKGKNEYINRFYSKC